jgi:hypothetical protein
MSDPPDFEDTITSSQASIMDPWADFKRLFGELEWLLKDGGVIASLTARNVNASIALVALEGLRAYLIENNKVQAAQDFATASEEIFGRLAASVIMDSERGGHS